MVLNQDQIDEIAYKTYHQVQDQIQKGFDKIQSRMDRLEHSMAIMQVQTASIKIVDQVEELERDMVSLRAQMNKIVTASLESKKSSALLEVDKSELSESFVPLQSRDMGEGPAYKPMNLRTVGDLSREYSDSRLIAEAEDHHHRPESMYNYCMHRLAVSQNPIREKAFYQWMLLVSVQFFTITAFVVSNDMNNNAIGATDPSQRRVALAHCMFSSSALWGVPFVQYCIGYTSIILVASVIRSDDKDSLMAAYPSQANTSSTASLWIAKGAWFWQTVYLPGCFALEAATMFASSPDAFSVVMNTLSVTFIMDIDNMLYRSIIAQRDKTEYQNHRDLLNDLPMDFASGCSWSMFVVNIISMTVMYSKIVATLGAADEYGDKYLDLFWNWIGPMYFCEFMVRRLLQSIWSIAGATQSWSMLLLQSLPRAVWNGCLSMMVYLLSFILVTLRFIAPPFFHFHASEFRTCLREDSHVSLYG